jgi:hypothetical protein
MIDEFLTKGLENDRYMKALRLAGQFEKEIEAELRVIGEEMVKRNRDLFDEPVKGRKSISTKSNSMPFARVDYPLTRFHSQENETRLVLNIHLYWDDPRNYNRPDIDGALRALGYKIKNIPETNEQRVVAETRDWPIRTSENRFGGEVAFYNHVSTADQVKETGEQLVDHFSTFADEYGVPRKKHSGD